MKKGNSEPVMQTTNGRITRSFQRMRESEGRINRKAEMEGGVGRAFQAGDIEVKEGNNVTNIKVRLILNTETNTYTYEYKYI